ncbi:PREDICTED: disease resistance protein RPM1-like [Ipomoea nil]|uniref:disease resistance protein RPM1-like n=1 Tax=Ipomoea nil TaxID=35883 RepID=UPI0009013445|nr:PREDICTED: disease resistance protein RPM1-like [Ipomoea nil]
MADAAVTFLLDQLSVLIREEYSLLGGIRDDAEDVKNAFDRLTAVLRVADETEESDPQVKAWVKIVRELAYDAEDVLDEFLIRFGGGWSSGGFYGKIKNIYTSVKNLRARRRLALALRRIKARVNNISQEQPSLLTTSAHTVHSYNKWWYDSRGDALLLEESDLVGIEKPKHFLVSLLLDVDDDLKIHSVVGMGGLGKTTLVKKVYDDAKVISHFQYHVWVTFSETFKIEELLKDAIKQLVEQTKQKPTQDFEAMNSNKLKEFIKNILSGQRYIIVLDDIWDINAWMAIKYSFPRQSFGSRILITTRNSEIGAYTSHETRGGIVYPLESLSSEDSWTLFCRKTFLCGLCPQHLVNIAKNILKRCDGLPLAIVVIAGVLATKSESIEEWERFQSCLNIQMESNDGMMNMKNLLSLSYYDLPYYLKYCFLYLSIFPEDIIIEKMRVIRLWNAEGFVRENGQHQVKEKVAEAYLNELLHRNLIQIVEKSDDGRMKGFRVHDILREVILSKSVEQNFTIIIATGQNIEPSNKFRRLAIHRFDENIIQCTSSNMHLRSLHFFEPLSSSAVSSSLSKMFTAKYIPLKVLDLRGAELEEIPDEVFNLFQLKYLSLRRTKLRSVSKSIGRLQNLETLDLKQTDVIELPNELLKLCKLWHLLVYRYQDEWSNPWISTQSFNTPFKIGELLSLQKLCFIQANDTNVVSEIGKLTQLRRLGVTKLRHEDGKEFCSSFEKLTNLCSLCLVSNSEDEILDIQHPLYVVPLRLRTLQLIGHLERVPQWLSSLVGLTSLRLQWNRLVEDPLPFFQDLPMLAYLCLLKSYEGEGLCFKAKKFSKLKHLRIIGFEALKWIRIEEGALHHLEEFYMDECKLLEQVPLGIQHLSNLKAISIHDMGDKLMASLEQNGENYAKISHIPEITISHIINGKRKYFFLSKG